jgi:hypothetical protein
MKNGGTLARHHEDSLTGIGSAFTLASGFQISAAIKGRNATFSAGGEKLWQGNEPHAPYDSGDSNRGSGKRPELKAIDASEMH